MAAVPHNSDNIEKWLKLINAEGVGSVGCARLIERFGSADGALGASAGELARVEGIGPITAEKIATSRERFDSAEELRLAEKLGVWLVNIADQRYPALLKRIYDPPPVLYVKGSLDRVDNLAVSIVGARRCSHYGREQSSQLAHLLASAGFTICSGLARGIDTAAHRGALAAGGRTIAVLGCGLANIFPPENDRLSGLIAESGACVSELPLRTGPLAGHFPPRNRIIAGLALGTIVVEAGLRSGALITAEAAVDYNREVMAVPGKVDSPLSRGTHKLLKEGARLIESVADVTEALGYVGRQLKTHVDEAAGTAAKRVQKPLFEPAQLRLSAQEKALYDRIETEPKHIEQLIAETQLQAGALNAAAVSLQLKGLIKQLPGSSFVRR